MQTFVPHFPSRIFFAPHFFTLEVSFFWVVATRAAPQFTSYYPHTPRISYRLSATHKYPQPDMPIKLVSYSYSISASITDFAQNVSSISAGKGWGTTLAHVVCADFDVEKTQFGLQVWSTARSPSFDLEFDLVGQRSRSSKVLRHLLTWFALILKSKKTQFGQ